MNKKPKKLSLLILVSNFEDIFKKSESIYFYAGKDLHF